MPTYYRLKTISYEGVIGYSKMIHLQKTAQGIVDLNKKFEGKLVITASGAEIRRFNQSVYHGNIKQMFNELTERSPSGMYSMVFFQYGAVETKTFKK